MNKVSSTPIPLSPEESLEASRLFGRSLFSALQLAREKEMQHDKLLRGMESEGDNKALQIPIPASLMPSHKVAAFGPPPYLGGPAEDYNEPAPVEGTLAHLKRNLGKYTGGYGGTLAGATLGALHGHKQNTRSAFGGLKGGLKGGLAGSAIGLGLGALLDSNTKEKYKVNMGSGESSKKEMIRSMLASGELEKILNEGSMAEKMGEDSYEPSIIGRAIKMQQNPMRMLMGGQSGFRDAKKDFYLQQKSHIQKELVQAQKEYIDLLSQIKTGSSEESDTPCVDAFCSGITQAALFGKTASDTDVDISDDSTKRFMREAMGKIMNPLRPAVDTAASGLLGTAGGTAMLTYLLRKEMRKQPNKYMEEQLPSRVELQPY